MRLFFRSCLISLTTIFLVSEFAPAFSAQKRKLTPITEAMLLYHVDIEQQDMNKHWKDGTLDTVLNSLKRVFDVSPVRQLRDASNGKAPSVSTGAEVGSVKNIVRHAYGTFSNTAKSPIFVQDVIVQNELLETVKGGGLHVVFSDESDLRMGSDSRLLIDSFVYAPKSPGEAMVMTAVLGSLRFITGKVASDKIKLNVPFGHIGVRGTDFQISIDNGITTVSVFKGEVELFGQHGEVISVPVGMMGQIAPNQPPSITGEATKFPDIPFLVDARSQQTSPSVNENAEEDEEAGNVHNYVFVTYDAPTAQRTSDGGMTVGGGVVSVGGGVYFAWRPPEPKHYAMATYHKTSNMFVVDDLAYYAPKISAESVLALIDHFEKNRKFGVDIFAGGISRIMSDNTSAIRLNSKLIRNLSVADFLMSQIIRGGTAWAQHYVFVDGFVPQKDDDRQTKEHNNHRFESLGFSVVDGVYVSNGIEFGTSIIPTKRAIFGDGTNISPVNLSRTADFQNAGGAHPYFVNYEHFENNFQYYSKEPAIKYALDVADTIGFIQTIYYKADNSQVME